MITTSKYEENGFDLIIAGLIRVYDPKIVVELGTQQGVSALIIGRALNQGKLFTYDLFLERYAQAPYAKTQANYDNACALIRLAKLEGKVQICTGDAFEVHKEFDAIDVLHIDLCNHYDNVARILPSWRHKVNKAIILEGGGYNKWQRECGFNPFTPLLSHNFVTGNFDVIIFKKNEDYALTVLIRRMS